MSSPAGLGDSTTSGPKANPFREEKADIWRRANDLEVLQLWRQGLPRTWAVRA